MSAFSIFQASFDGGLRPQHRRKARWAAILVIVTFVAIVGGGFLTILHLNSNQLSDMANAGTPRDVRTASTGMPQARSCAEQSWPFIEGRCLIDTKSLRQSERALPRQALARQLSALHHDAGLVARKKRARAKSPIRDVAIASRAKATQTAAATTGAAPRDEQKAQPARTPELVAATPRAAAPSARPTPPKNQTATVAVRRQERPLREARRKDRLTREQREARAEMRSRRDEMRSASRWNDGAYSSYGGGSQRGFFDGFFSTIR